MPAFVDKSRKRLYYIINGRKEARAMIIISDRDLPLARRTVLTIGAFDGVHIGHACLLGAMRTVSAEKGLRNCVWTFAENPK